MKQVMDGALTLESRIFDSTANTWKVAADVVPCLDLSQSPASAWQPPAKPQDLRGLHVVDLNAEPTGNVDYFALINDRKRVLQRPHKNRPNKDSSSEHSDGHQFLGQEAKNSSRSAQKSPAALRDAETSSGSASIARPIDRHSEQTLLTLEPDRGMILNFVQRMKDGYRTHKTSLSIAAGLGLVFLGTFGLVVTMSDRKGREPAATPIKNKNAVKPFANTTPPGIKSLAGGAMPSTAPDSIGSGHNRIPRQQPVAQAAPQRPTSLTPPSSRPETNDAPRDQPQFYSTTQDDPNNQPAQPPVAATVPNAQDVYPPPANPNTGVVDPPAFYPPPQDPNSAVPPNSAIPPANNANDQQAGGWQ